MSTSTFTGETSFAILIAILGLVLFAHLIGNMQVLIKHVFDWFNWKRIEFHGKQKVWGNGFPFTWKRTKFFVPCKLPPWKIMQSNTSKYGKYEIVVIFYEKEVKSNAPD